MHTEYSIQKHTASEVCKSRGSRKFAEFIISEGDIVHIKNEGSKHHDVQLKMFSDGGEECVCVCEGGGV